MTKRDSRVEAAPAVTTEVGFAVAVVVGREVPVRVMSGDDVKDDGASQFRHGALILIVVAGFFVLVGISVESGQ
jgi:hypothetical protein